jgi:hypothetical protein
MNREKRVTVYKSRILALPPGLFSSRMEEMPGFPPLPHTVMPRLDLGISMLRLSGCHEAFS